MEMRYASTEHVFTKISSVFHYLVAAQQTDFSVCSGSHYRSNSRVKVNEQLRHFPLDSISR